MNLVFTEAKEVPNKTNPDKDPWLSLGYQTGKRQSDFTFGSKKAYYFLENLENMVEARNNHNPEDGLFLFKCVIDAGTKWASEVEITNAKLDLLIHYKAEIEEFLKKYPYKAFVRTAIEKPFVKVEERGVDYVKVLYLPCWEKGENDEGEGLIPKKITQKSADFLLKRAFGGSAFKAFQAGIAENMEKITDEYTAQSGEVFKSDYDLATMKCFVKYKALLMEFALSGSIDE